jgi:asparaginyl-tRNA synthetase
MSKQIDKKMEENLKLLSERYKTIRRPRDRKILEIQSSICDYIKEFLDKRGFMWFVAPIISPATDPGIRGAERVKIDYYGSPFFLTTSAILQKQILAAIFGKIYFFSQNIRLEKPESVATGRHLCEFTQVDIEQSFANCNDAMKLAEDLLFEVCFRVNKDHQENLNFLGRELKIPQRPFQRLKYSDAIDILSRKGFELDRKKEIPWDAEKHLSEIQTNPIFICEYPKAARGFYDREDPNKSGILLDFDLVYPEGYGEAVSGAEREFEFEKVLERMKANGENLDEYKLFLDALKYRIDPSAGFGIGLERLTRYVCGLDYIWEASIFPKVANIVSL